LFGFKNVQILKYSYKICSDFHNVHNGKKLTFLKKEKGIKQKRMKENEERKKQKGERNARKRKKRKV
jgi:hypothetical protein